MATEEMKNEQEGLSTKCTEEEKNNGVEDENGVLYSKDGKRLLKCENEELTKYTIKEGTKVICDEAFSGCESLVSIEMPEGLISIGNMAFEWCKNLKSIGLIEELIYIGFLAFNDCRKLKPIKLPEGLVSIGNGAFGGCIKLKVLELPKSLREIDGNPFVGCYANITSKSPLFKVENELLIQGNKVIAAVGDPTSVIIPDYITSIGDGAFCECKKLISIEMPEGVNEVGFDPFMFCDSLEKIYIRCSADADEAAVIENFKDLFPYGEYFYEQFEIVKK